MQGELIDVELFAKELDAIVRKVSEGRYRLAYAGRHQNEVGFGELPVTVEEFAIGSLPGNMVLFEYPVASEDGMTPDEAIKVAALAKAARERLDGKEPETAPAVLH